MSQSQWFPWRKLIPQSGVTVAVVPVEKVDTSKRCHNDSGPVEKVIPQSGVTVAVVPVEIVDTSKRCHSRSGSRGES